MESHYYNVNIRWDRDRKGTMISPELVSCKGSEDSCIVVATPPEFPKGIPGIWSPEHLFTASINSCLMTTFLAIAENSNLEFTSFDCNAKGKLEKVDGKFIMSEVLLEPTVTIVNEKDRDRTERIIRKSEAGCLITNSVKSNIIMNVKIVVNS